VRSTIDDDQLHLRSQFLQVLKIPKSAIETSDNSESRDFHGRDLRGCDDPILEGAPKSRQYESVFIGIGPYTPLTVF
jgi:hypothetical protein